jgi:hypothetical protein
MPCLAAVTLVAPGVLFNDFAIFVTPALAFAIVFNVRKSSLVHGRRTTLFFLANVRFLFSGVERVAQQTYLAILNTIIFTKDFSMIGFGCHIANSGKPNERIEVFSPYQKFEARKPAPTKVAQNAA